MHAEAAARDDSGARPLVFAVLVLYAAFGEVATGLLVPALPLLSEIYGRTPATIQLTIVSFAVMFGCGQLFFGPFSDRNGRRTALLIGAGLTLTGSVVAATADGVAAIVVGRSLQGLGAASGYVVSRAIVRDLYGAEGSARAMATLFALMAASFLAAPLVGGLLMDLGGWRPGFMVAAVAALVWLASTIFILPETRVAAPAAEARTIPLVYLGLCRHRAFLVYMTVHSLAYAGLFCFVSGAPYYFIGSLGVGASTFGMIAAVAMSGFLAGSTAARYAIPRRGTKQVILISLAIMLCAPAVLVGLDLLAGAPLPVIVAIQFAYWFGGGLLAPNTASGVMLSHPKAAGAAAAVLGFVQMGAAATVATLQGLIYDGSLIPMVGMQLLLGVATWVIWQRLKRHTG
jgi:MFS transporter, DHA1 family, multidrug resistance protein